jgi:protein-disulfide isomerase
MRRTFQRGLDVMVTVGCLVLVPTALIDIVRRALPLRPVWNGPVESLRGVKLPLNAGLTKRIGAPGVALVEFADFECPYCGQFARGAYRAIDEEFIKTGRVAFALFNLPLDSHKNALTASRAVDCAADQGYAWQMHDRLFENQAALGMPNLIEHGRAIGLDVSSFRRCVDGRISPRLEYEIQQAKAVGVGATPTFFVGRVDSDGYVDASQRIIGAAPYDVFKKALNEVLVSVGGAITRGAADTR